MKHVIRILPVVYMALIWVLSSMPADAVVELPNVGVDRFIKESLHLVEFGILYALLFFAGLTFGGRFKPLWSFIFMGVAILYGAIDEIHQSFVPYRSATWIDFVKDTIGVLVASHFMHHAYFSGKFVRLGDWLRKFAAWVR
ncbi:VanZ like family protein [Mesobacillus persicus]|uniref:VanZ like family protein n=1 Tax=Mesobacillus persicus TaxID=930146 RepID=A0A1H8H3U3_9BACI|nr:VanZ family protein [Mesobacillus persicus]SEN50689.1 VanZ like family protein [Mesobacillus persicus]